MNGHQSTFLDFLRVFAAQLVLVNHIISASALTQPLKLGNFGVLIFFTLSGFLICYTTLEKRSANSDFVFGKYFVDRFFRIFVPYIPCLFLILFLDTLLIASGGHHEFPQYVSVKQFIANLFMLQQHPLGLFADKIFGWVQLKFATFGSGRPLWTVATEWWIYIMFGWMLLKQDTLRSHPFKFFIVLTLVGMAPLFNMVAGTGEGMALVWFVSAGLAYGYFQWTVQGKYPTHKLNQHSNLAGIIMLFILGLMILRIVWVSVIQNHFQWKPFEFYDFSFGFLFVLAFFLVFVWLGTNKGTRRYHWSKFMADYSYSLYLIHYPIVHFLRNFEFNLQGGLGTALIYFVVCNVSAILFWWAFERHFPTLKKAWLNRAS